MPLRLRVHLTEQPSSMKILLEGRSYVLGRGESADIQILDPGVSRTHAKLHVVDGAWWMEDLDSRYGCYQNDERIRRVAIADSLAAFRLGRVICDATPISYKEASSFGNQLAWQKTQIRNSARRLAEPMELNALATAATETLQNLFPRERAALLILDEQGEVLSACGNPQWSQKNEFRVSRSAIARAVQQQTPLVLSNIHIDHQLSQADSVVSYGIQSLICVPVVFAQRVYAVLYADSCEVSRRFTELDLEVVRAYARQLGHVFGLRFIDQELAKTQLPL
ncbi:MAG: GAF domain-containing protein [Gammaproteobacteria bacterium]|nr:GAF domain-containing protein [Gammaproteobacteria bacterium]